VTITHRGIFTTASLAAIATLSAPATADTGKVRGEISGQINRAVLWADNGTDSDVGHVDNDNSSTRFRIRGSADVTENTQAGITWETEFESNTSSKFDINQNSDGSADFKERKLEAWFKGPWGKLSIGQGDGAANGTSEMDLSGTTVIAYSGLADMAGGITFKTTGGADIVEGVAVGDVFNNLDGLSRNDRLRYDTPAFGPLGFAVSATNGDAYEIATRLVQDIGDNSFEAAIGYVDGGDRSPFSQIGASASFLHASGLNVTVAIAERNLDESGHSDPSNRYVKIGYHRGAHRFAIDYGMTDDLAADGDEATSYGAFWNWQAFASGEIYAGVRIHELDRPGIDVDDVTAIMAGTRVKF
jgi:predicted porin